MTDVVEVDGLSRVDAWDAFHVLVEQLWDRDDRAHAGALEMDRPGLDTKGRADQCLQPRQWATGLTARNGGQRLALFRLAVCVYHYPARPVTIRHLARSPRYPRKPQMVQGNVTVAPVFDVVDMRHDTVTMRRSNRALRCCT